MYTISLQYLLTASFNTSFSYTILSRGFFLLHGTSTHHLLNSFVLSLFLSFFSTLQCPSPLSLVPPPGRLHPAGHRPPAGPQLCGLPAAGARHQGQGAAARPAHRRPQGRHQVSGPAAAERPQRRRPVQGEEEEREGRGEVGRQEERGDGGVGGGGRRRIGTELNESEMKWKGGEEKIKSRLKLIPTSECGIWACWCC